MANDLFVSTASTDMASRPSTAFQRFTDYADIRDDKYLLFGDGGDAGFKYNSTRDVLIGDGLGTAIEIRGLNMARDRYELVERFQKAPKVNADILSATEATNEICNRDFEVLGTNATSGSSLVYVEGGIELTTAGADDDQVIILPHLDANETAWATTTWGTDQQVRWEAVVQLPATITTYHVWAGLKLTNTSVLATDNDQAYFYFNTEAGSDATKWHAVYSIGGTDTDDGSSGVVAAASTTYHLIVDIDSSRIARFYVNGTKIKTSTALTDATDLKPYIGVQALSAAARALRVFKTAISRKAGA